MNWETDLRVSTRRFVKRDESVAIARLFPRANGFPIPAEQQDTVPEVRQPAGCTADAPDEALLKSISNDDDRAALAVLFRRYATMVRTLADRILRDPAEAEDVVQEVFMFVFRKAGLYDPARGSARSWLVQVTYHRAFDRRRYLVSRGFYAHLELDEVSLRVEQPQATVFSYEDTIEAAIGRDALRRIQSSLSEVQRDVLRLRFVDGYTVEEIATILGQSPGNVRNHYYRALEKMRREIFGTKLQTK